MATVEVKKFPLQQVLELACAAQRSNNDYIKTVEPVITADGVTVAYKHANRQLMLVALGEDKTTYPDPKLMPQLITTNLDDRELANDIQKFYKRLAFAAIQGDNEFQTEVNALLNSTEVPVNRFGFIACLPSTYQRDYANNQFEKRVKLIDREHLAPIGFELVDLDCDIISSKRSKNFDAYNIDAIIDNKMVSWMSKNNLKLGACVLLKGKVKDHSMHWKHNDVPVTRLNYVKAFQ
jgi:hypothetical protein